MNDFIVIDNRPLDPDPMTIRGTSDLVEMFYALKTHFRKSFVNQSHDDNDGYPPTKLFLKMTI